MPANANQIGTNEVNFSLDREFLNKFNQENDRLLEILGIATVETVAAGTALYQLKVTGELNDDEPASGEDAEDNGSSGAGYVEGDLVALSKYEVSKEPVGSVNVKPYRKQVTAQAVLEAGYIPAVYRTDDKMIKQVRAGVIDDFFTFLATGTGTPASYTDKGLQAALAYADGKLGDTLETNGDSSSNIIHFVNRQDIAKYLATANITLQTLYGMNYIESFLGVNQIFVTNKVTAGTVIATPAENIRVFGVDFASLGQAGLSYTTSANGLIGVNHEPGYDRVSAYTNVLVGATMFAEVKDYIVKAPIK